MPVNAIIPSCPKCSRPILGKVEEHSCPPLWRVWRDGENRGLGQLVYAQEAETAAEAWAEHDDNDSAEYDIAKGQPALVCTAREPDGTVEKFRVHGEYQPVYWAEPLA